MSLLNPEFFESLFDAKYFAQMFAHPDTEIFPDEAELPEDNKDLFERNLMIQAQKKQLKLARMKAIKNGIREPWFKLLETALLGRARQIEGDLIWKAKAEGNKAKEEALTMERTGIIKFFEAFGFISQAIATVEGEIAELKKRSDHPDDLDLQAKIQ